jgi:hypothetical protein
MKTITKRITFITLGITVVSSIALSNSLLGICKVCNPVPKPKYMCVQGETPPLREFCGAERWLVNGTPECKRFETVTYYCASGETIKDTEEQWFGPGTTCADATQSGNHDCH